MMSMIDAIAARLDQSVRMAGNLGIELPSADLASENRIRNAIWRCILCRHGRECREWVEAGKPGVPAFCGNRDFYLERARNAG